jgi:enoyl-CoA hydratase/carnithine racemase
VKIMGEHRFIDVEREGLIGIVTLNRPENYNSWHAPMRIEVADALRTFNADPSIRALIITGTGDAFSGGQDLAEAMAFDAARAIEWMEEWRNLYGAFRELDKPIVAALNGVAAGSAFQAALLCDIRVGHSGSLMGQTEIDSGIPSVTGTWLMWDVIGRLKTVEMVLTGQLLDGDECHRIGLINYLVPKDQVMTRAREVAAQLAAKPPVAMRLNKQRFRELTETGFLDAEQAGARIQSEAFASGEPRAMMEQFFAVRAERKRGASQ